MFINRGPLIILVALSVTAYQRSKRAGRSPLFWLPLLWIAALACGILGQLLAMQIIADDAPARQQLLGWSEAIGQVLGAIVVTIAAGKPLPNEAAIVNSDLK